MNEYRVLHVLPHLQRRGAPVTSCELFLQLLNRGIDGRLAVLFPGEDQIGITGHPDVHVGTSKNRLRAFFWLRSIIAQYRPRLILAHGGEPFEYCVYTRLSSRNVPLIYRKIGLTAPWIKSFSKPRFAYQRWLIGNADSVVCIGEKTKDELIKVFGGLSSKIHTIYRGFSIRTFDVQIDARETVRRNLEIPQTAKVLISVGNLSPEKNQQALIRLLPALKMKKPDIVLLLVGGGPDMESLKTLADTLHVSDSVYFTGPRKDIPELLAASDIFVLSSLIEGVPGVLIEAGISGLPCVSWDVAGADEVIQHEVTGLITPFKNDDALLAAVARLLDHPAEGFAMGNAAKALCRERFSMTHCLDRYIEVFDGLLSRGSL